MSSLEKFISGFLGLSMFMFGVLKFVEPFRGWYSLQISSSELPFPAYPLGIAGEILTGLILLTTVFFSSKLPDTRVKQLVTGAGISVVLMMVAAIYVHMHPAVPADVLPLKIKPPFIPCFFLILALYVGYSVRKRKGAGT